MDQVNELAQLRRAVWRLWLCSRAPLSLRGFVLRPGGILTLENGRVVSPGNEDFYITCIFRRAADLPALRVTAESINQFDLEYVQTGEVELMEARVADMAEAILAGVAIANGPA